MKRIRCVLSLLAAVMFLAINAAEIVYDKLPRAINIAPQDKFHVQGVAVDMQNEVVYLSFTSSLIKTDFQGNIIGSVVNMGGCHLGCLSFNPDDGTLYASCEYKSDEIGRSLRKSAGKIAAAADEVNETGFYVASFNGDEINRVGIDAEESGIMRLAFLSQVFNDYFAGVRNKGKEVKHRFGCSGIDGTAVAPALRSFGRNNRLFVAYGIYGDTTRTDNDYQVILEYDIKQIQNLSKAYSSSALHRSGPEKPVNIYFVLTGNTTYGVQNLNYDRDTGNLFMAVYKGKKSCWPNYNLYVIDGNRKPEKRIITGVEPEYRAKTLQLVENGCNKVTPGWNAPGGATGLCSVGNGYFYIAKNAKNKEGRQYCTVELYRWMPETEAGFVKVE